MRGRMRVVQFVWLCCFLVVVVLGRSSSILAQTQFHPPKSQGEALDRLYADRTKMQKGASGSTPAGDSILLPELVLSSKKIPQTGSKADDKISRLPGQPAGALDFKQYSGYITVDDQAGRALFYYFTEAPGNLSSSAPLVLWLNGGPGCSSFGYGAMQELGPFRVGSDGKTLFKNPYAWNRVANVIYLESPAGVGFSYSNSTSDYLNRGDNTTAEDSYIFMVNWLERFPEYKGRDLYLSGESYAGHYVPQLARQILHHNMNENIQLKGILIGNPAIDDESDVRGLYEYMWSHGIISDETFWAINASCTFNSPTESPTCDKAQAHTNAGNLDFYNIYGPLCNSEELTPKPKQFSIENPDPCCDTYTAAYLNLPQVQRALHANTTNLNHPWFSCSPVVKYIGNGDSILPLLKELMNKSIRILLYSGDVDARVPLTSTRYSMRKMKLRIETPWAPWTVDKEVGGYSCVYQGNLTFATVRGAGHEVPTYQPERSLLLVNYFLQGKPLPS